MLDCGGGRVIKVVAAIVVATLDAVVVCVADAVGVVNLYYFGMARCKQHDGLCFGRL